MLTEQELAAIRARAEAATFGPWTDHNDDVLCGDDYSVTHYPEDRDFIAHARADIPALLAEVERLRAAQPAAAPAAAPVPDAVAKQVEATLASSATEACCYELANDAAQPAPAPAPQWVPVGERLPPLNEAVITYFGDGNYDMQYWDGEAWEPEWKNSPPTHWQPLPEPPKEGSDGS